MFAVARFVSRWVSNVVYGEALAVDREVNDRTAGVIAKAELLVLQFPLPGLGQVVTYEVQRHGFAASRALSALLSHHAHPQFSRPILAACSRLRALSGASPWFRAAW